MAKNTGTGTITINNWGAGMSANDYGGAGIKQMINCEPDSTGKYVRLIEGYADNKEYSGQDACIGVVFDDKGNYYALFEDRYLARYYNSSDYEVTLIGAATEDFRSCVRRKDDIFVLQDTKLSVFRGTRINYDTDVEWNAGDYTDGLITFQSGRGQDFQKRAIMITVGSQMFIFNKTVVYRLKPEQLDLGDTNIEEFATTNGEIQAVYVINGLIYIHTLSELVIMDISGESTTTVDWSNIRVLEGIALNNLGIVLAEMGDKWAIIEVQGTQKRVLYEFDAYTRPEGGYYSFSDQSFFAQTYKTRKHMMCVLSNSVYIQHDGGILKLTLAGQSYRLSEYYNTGSFDIKGGLYASKQGVLYHDSVVAPTIYKIKLENDSRFLYSDTGYVVTEKLDGGAAGVEKNLLDVTLWYAFKNSSGSNSTAETSSFTLEYRVDEDSSRTSIATIPYSSSRQRWYNITLNKSFYEIQFRVSINRGSKLLPWKEPILYSLAFNYELTNGLTT